MTISFPTSTNQYEVEIKSLIGTKARADKFRTKLERLFKEKLKLTEQSSQLNHYFIGESLDKVHDLLLPHIPNLQHDSFSNILHHGKNISVRTRKLNDQVILVMKASIDDTTSSNGISRLEFEVRLPSLTLDQLDQLLLDAGLQYQAKWSRWRESFQAGNVTISIDKNAGYGYLAEFEMLVGSADNVDHAKKELRKLMEKLGVKELGQKHLERMFAYYNSNWKDYYGTEKTFTIEE